MTKEWYSIDTVDQVDSPALAVYVDRVQENIKRLVNTIDSVSRLRPHIKTHKSQEVARMMLASDINKFKCATISEAEMLAEAGATDILLAYQPVGPKALRLAKLASAFPHVTFACLIDNTDSAAMLDAVFQQRAPMAVYIDLNVGMNRTGIVPAKAFDLIRFCKKLKGIQVRGLHAYDGHLRDTDFEIRKKKCDEAFAAVEELQKQVQEVFNQSLVIIAGGTPTYSIHCKRKNIECSPGTFIYWDAGYEQTLREQHYLHAALVITRIISKPSPGILCIDLGHKAIASENPLANRVHFLNAPDLEPVGHSEEHMVLKTAEWNNYRVGDVLYGVPFHVCPTVALHDQVVAVEDHQVQAIWKTKARARTLTY